MRSRISIRGCDRPSVRPSVTHELKPRESAVFDQDYYQYKRERILWSCVRPCSLQVENPNGLTSCGVGEFARGDWLI